MERRNRNFFAPFRRNGHFGAPHAVPAVRGACDRADGYGATTEMRPFMLGWNRQ